MSNATAITISADSAEPVSRPRTARSALTRCWLSAVTLTRRHAAVSQSLISIVDQAVVSGTSFLSVVILGRASAPEQLGHYYMTLTVVLVLVGLQEALVAAPYIVFGARRCGRELAEYTGSMWMQHAVLTVAGVGVVAVLASLAMQFPSGGLVYALWTVAAVIPWILFREGIRRFAFARLRSGIALAIDVAVCFVQLTALLALSYFGRLSVPTTFFTIGLANALAGIGWLLSKPERPIVSVSRLASDWWNNWEFARWTVMSYFMVDTIPFVMPWIIGLAAGPAATGIYGGSSTLVGVTNILIHGAGNFVRPKAAHAFATEGVSALKRFLLIVAAVYGTAVGAFCIVLFLTGDLVAVFVFGSEFRGTGWVLTLLSVNVLLGSIGFVASCGLWALGVPRSGMIADLAVLVITLLAAALLIGRYGPVGAATAVVLGSAVGATLKCVTFKLATRKF